MTVTVPRMHADEVLVDDTTVRRLLMRDRPDLAVLPRTRVTTWGTDHVIYRLGGDLAMRLPKMIRAAGQGIVERRWLPLFAPHLPVTVSIPLFVGKPDDLYPFDWYISPWIVGDPVDVTNTDTSTLAVDLAAFVLALQGVESSGAPGALPGQRGGPLAAADSATTGPAHLLRDDLDVDTLLAIWQAGVDAAPWTGPPRWVHGDLMDGNVLMSNGRLGAVIDWGALKGGDPAVELMIAWSLFDSRTRETYRTHLAFVDDAMWLRGRAWATSAALQALAYYRHTNPDIVARSQRTVKAVLEDHQRGR